MNSVLLKGYCRKLNLFKLIFQRDLFIQIFTNFRDILFKSLLGKYLIFCVSTVHFPDIIFSVSDYCYRYCVLCSVGSDPGLTHTDTPELG